MFSEEDIRKKSYADISRAGPLVSEQRLASGSPWPAQKLEILANQL